VARFDHAGDGCRDRGPAAWSDPAYKKRLLADGTAAIKEFGHDMGALNLVVVENTPEVHT